MRFFSKTIPPTTLLQASHQKVGAEGDKPRQAHNHKPKCLCTTEDPHSILILLLTKKNFLLNALGKQVARITYRNQMRTRTVTKNIPEGSNTHTYYSREHMEQTYYILGSILFLPRLIQWKRSWPGLLYDTCILCLLSASSNRI